jgi:phage host-nuclease inhibitor protein Gam
MNVSGDPVTWVAVLTAIGALVSIAKFWMEMGATKQQAESAQAQAIAAHAAVEILKGAVSDLGREIAREYATHEALRTSEERMTAAVSGMRDEIRGLNERIDKFIVGVFNRDT